MKAIITISFLLTCLHTAIGQSDIERLADRLTEEAHTDYHKVERIYTWVTSNIKYDIRQLKDIDDFEHAQSPEVVQSKKIAVCQGYANLMKALLDQAQVTNEVVMGDARTENDDNLQRHSWNAILIDSSWHLVDATWDAGYIRDRTFVRRQSTDFFLQKPSTFIHTHLPDDPIWQLLPTPVSLVDFNQKVYPEKEIASGMRSDSLLQILTRSPAQKRIRSAERQIAYNPNNFIGYYELGMSYFEQANAIGKAYEEKTTDLKSRSQWLQDKSELEKLLIDQEVLLQMAFSNFETLEQKSAEYRATAQKNMSILNSVLRNIKNEQRLLNDL